MARQKIELTPEEAEELSRRGRATTVSVRDRRRAEIIVLSAQGLTQQRIAEQLGISRVAVNRWVGRFALHRLDGLTDRAGRGRKPWLPPATVRQVVEQAVTPPAHLGFRRRSLHRTHNGRSALAAVTALNAPLPPLRRASP